MFLDPDLALRCALELPDGGDLLELVDAPLAGPERLGPVLGGSDDQHDVLADLDVPVPVDDEDFDHVEVLQGALPDLAELLLGHPLVILELDAGNVVALGPVPGGAQENRDPPDAVRAGPHPRQLGVDREVLPLDPHQHALTLSGYTCRTCLRPSPAGQCR